jgi:hypothetical protein
MSFSVGDTVQLKLGSPDITVTRIATAGLRADGLTGSYALGVTQKSPMSPFGTSRPFADVRPMSAMAVTAVLTPA